MIKKVMITLLSMFFVACGVLMIVAFVFFLTPSRKAAAGISLPSQVEDSADLSESDSTEDDSTYDNIYVADVHQSLTLRKEPDSNAEPVMEEGLAPMTHMQVINYVENTNFAYVKVINGNYEGYTGYVNYEFITRLGEPTIRVDSVDTEGE